jgi:hypothetical protein
MEDARVWDFERSLWEGEPDTYRKLVDEECLMVLPEHPYVFTGEQAIAAVEATPRWAQVSFSEEQIARPQECLIVIAYKVEAHRSGKAYAAFCTTTMRRLDHDTWRVLQHQQTVPLTAG